VVTGVPEEPLVGATNVNKAHPVSAVIEPTAVEAATI